MEIREFLARGDVMGRLVTRVRKVDGFPVLLDLRDDPALMAYLAFLVVEVADLSSSVTLMR